MPSFTVGAELPSLPKSCSDSLNHVVQAILVRNPEMRPSAVALLKHERVKFSMERRSLLVLKSDLEGRELAISDAMRDIGGKVEHLRSMISDYQEPLNTSPEVLRAALDRREAEMYHMIQAKEQEAKDAFHRREMELLEALEKRDEDMRFIRARLEKLVSGSKSTDACKAARSLLNGVKDILHPPAASPMTEVVLTATGEVAVADDDGDHGWKYGAHSRAVCAKQRWGHFFVKDR
ncbi:hypothetical protein B0H13DRAFT_1851157 [Mycena leptocephala]|nr:hypothetical protein B0H13DRAFT_1851157 [Mycena leptocephala]